MIPLDTDELVAFLESASKRNLLVALITSGGTAVPLEINMVRFLDNFSNGSRGALSAEQFLEHGYAVVFLYRRYSNLPFYRASITEHWMDMLEPGSLIVRKDPLECYNLLKELSEKREKYSKNLILIPYFSLEEYMSWLEFTCTSLDSFGKRALIYSAAAVSDFYIPSERLSEHKIDSASMELVLNLVPVRKMLGIIRTEWCPNAVLISFKLETDSTLLLVKSHESLKKYNQDLVIANLLHTRKQEVYFVFQTGLIEHLTLQDCDSILEKCIVEKIVSLHRNKC